MLWYVHDKRRQYDFKGILASPPYIGSLESYLHFSLEPTMGNNLWLSPLFWRLSMDILLSLLILSLVSQLTRFAFIKKKNGS